MLNPFFYLQAVFLALGQIWANKFRSILTTLGIIFGVWAVTTVVAAISGVTSMVLSEFESLGGSKMFIFPDRPDDAPRNKYPWPMIRLKPEELQALADLVSHELTHLPIDATVPEGGQRYGLCSGVHARALMRRTIDEVILPSLAEAGLRPAD